MSLHQLHKMCQKQGQGCETRPFIYAYINSEKVLRSTQRSIKFVGNALDDCMSDLSEIVDGLENKISKLLHKVDLLGQANERLQNELNQQRSEFQSAASSVSEWEEKYNSLKLANSMLGSENDKTEAKLKINALIREIDQCIAQLAE